MTFLKQGLTSLFTMILSVVSFGACAQSPKVDSGSYQLMLKTLLAHTVPELSVEKVKELEGDVFFLDAREQNEYDVSHIEGARFVGYDDFDIAAAEGIPKEQPVVVYCSVGYRSEKIAEQLLAAGYTEVYNMYGGIFEWKNKGNDVVNLAGAKTESVHAYNRTWGVWLRKGEKVYE